MINCIVEKQVFEQLNKTYCNSLNVYILKICVFKFFLLQRYYFEIKLLIMFCLKSF